MMYTYHIDVNDNIAEAETFINEPWVCLDKTEVEFLVKMLKIKRRNSILEQLDYLRDALRSPAGIGVLTYYSLVRAIVDKYFKTDFKIKEPKYYVHVLPQQTEGYLNASDEAPNNQLDPTAPKIVCYLEKVEGGANAIGTIKGTYTDKLAMISFLIMRFAKGDRETLEDIIEMSKTLFDYDKAKERKHD